MRITSVITPVANGLIEINNHARIYRRFWVNELIDVTPGDTLAPKIDVEISSTIGMPSTINRVNV